MANELKTATVQSILALHQKRWSHRRIARELGIDRGTVARYVRLAAEAAEAERCSARAGGETAGSKPADAPIGANSKPADAPIGASPGGEHFEPAITPMGSEGSASQPAASSLLPSRQSDCEPWREVIRAKCEQGLSAKRIHQDLVGDLGARVSYDSVRRFLRRLGRTRPLPFRRMECEPGEEAQVDFGKGAPVLMPGGRRRRPHLFRVVLSHSRKAYSEASWRQTTEDFIRCLENAFWHCGGCPKVLVIDNLRAAVKHPELVRPGANPPSSSRSASITAGRSCLASRTRPVTKGRSSGAWATPRTTG